MNNLSTYIIEKLRINKKTEVDSCNKLVDTIYDIYHEISNIFDKHSNEITELVEKWYKDNNVKDYIIYSSYNFKYTFEKNKDVVLINDEEFDEMLEDNNLDSTRNSGNEYVNRFTLDSDEEYIDTCGNDSGFTISGWETFKGKSAYGQCILIKIESYNE